MKTAFEYLYPTAMKAAREGGPLAARSNSLTGAWTRDLDSIPPERRGHTSDTIQGVCLGLMKYGTQKRVLHANESHTQ